MASRGVQLDPKKTRYLCRAKGWSQRDLASASGLDPRTIRKAVEGGTCDSRTHLLIANALAVAPEEILDVDSFLDSLLDSANSSSPDAASQRTALNAVGPQSGSDFQVELNWKTIDLRKSARCLGEIDATEDIVTMWDFYRIRKLRSDASEISFTYQTWGEGIECLSMPSEAEWSCQPVRPGELYHSRERWELTVPLKMAKDEVADLVPIQLQFRNAFEPPDNAFWQAHVAFPMAALHLQVLFPETDGEWFVGGSTGDMATRDMIPVSLGPATSPAANSASWIIPAPTMGTYYKIAWSRG